MPLEDPPAISLIETYSTDEIGLLYFANCHETNVYLLRCLLYCLFVKCRDGVGEGQFNQVLLYEMDAIRNIVYNKVLCLRLGGNVTWMYYTLPSIFRMNMLKYSEITNFSVVKSNCVLKLILIF